MVLVGLVGKVRDCFRRFNSTGDLDSTGRKSP